METVPFTADVPGFQCVSVLAMGKNFILIFRFAGIGIPQFNSKI